MKPDEIKSLFTYSCYHTESRSGEQFVSEHSLTYQIAGNLALSDGQKTVVSKPGSLVLVKRNNLVKFVKTPPEGADFESISLRFSQELLRATSIEYGFKAKTTSTKSFPVVQFKMNDLLKSFISSLLAYHRSYKSLSSAMIELKIKEGILTMIEAKPEMKEVLFNFSDPHKINLEAYMNQNFHFNVHLDRFAYMTGRSLATFKRDFQKIYGTTPGKWLVHKRLQMAHFLITERHKHPSDIYLDLGFEDLSHFSYAFKKEFGQAPSKVPIAKPSTSISPRTLPSTP
jgi:AraC-like DNA-binding protein